MRRVLVRLDAFLVEAGPDARLVWLDRVAIVGNKDGAHNVAAELFQARSDVGVTIPAGGVTCRVGKARRKTDYQDLASGGEKTNQATSTSPANAAHLARLLLADDAYPAQI